MMERMYGRKRHLEEQRKFKEYDGISQRIWKEISQGRERRSKVTRDQWRWEDIQ